MSQPQLSIVVPTLNETSNIPFFVKQLTQVLQRENIHWEIIFVDDSTDETPLLIKTLAAQQPRIRLHHRSKEARTGLATALLKGIQLANGSHVLVMDADLQHPPELIAPMWRKARHYDVVMPTRYLKQGGRAGLDGSFRQVVSWATRQLPRLLFPKIRPCSDPGGGFFLIRKDCIALERLQPRGWKMLLEILVLSDYQSFTEIPYVFQARLAGESKASLKAGFDFALHLLSLSKRYYFPAKHVLKPLENSQALSEGEMKVA